MSSRLSRTFSLAAAATLVASGVATLAPTAARGAPAASFSAPMILTGGGAEPSIRVANDGKTAAYVSAPSGVGSNFWRITEKNNGDGTMTLVQSPVQQPDLGTGGGDSEISVGNAPVSEGCNQIAYSGLHNIDLLDNFTVATSTDCGKTFQLTNPYATQNTLTDRQWQAFDGKKTNFLIYHKVDTSQIVVSESIDGGQTYVSLSPDGSHGIIDATTMPAVANTNQVGNIVTDYSQATGSNNLLSGEPTHVMYATFGGPRDAADNAQAQIDGNAQGAAYNHVDTVYLAKSTDGGLTWTDTKVYGVDPASHRELNMLFPVVDVDKAGNVYVVWADGFKVEYAVSTDHGATFSKPYQVNHDNKGLVAGTGAEKPDPGKADLFPWIAAGANGMIDVVWYHGQGGSATSNLAYRDPGDKNTEWTVAFAQLGSATHTSGGAAAPTELTYTDAITPVIHRGDICQNGTFCSLVPIGGTPFSDGDRSLLDFFEVAIDNAGRANIALADNVDAPGALFSAYIRQTSGYSLTTGQVLPPQHLVPPKLVCTPDAAFTDPSGDATELVVATPLPNAPALDVTKGWVSYDASAGKLVLHIKVSDLKQDPPVGSTGEQFEFGFAYAGNGYYGVASHDASQTADDFHMESPLRTTVGSGLTGAFDKANSEVRIEIPGNFFHGLGKGPVLAPGAKISGLTITARRNQAGVLVPNVDEAGSLGCVFVLGASATSGGTPGSVPAPTVNRPVPGHLATTGTGSGLPLIAAGFAVGALAVRRRRAA